MKLKSSIVGLVLLVLAGAIPFSAIFSKSLFFQNNDDLFIMGRASGMFYGEPSSDLIYLSTPLSQLLKYLYLWSGQWSWYTLGIIFTQFLSVLMYLFLFKGTILKQDGIWAKAMLTFIVSIPIVIFYILFFSLQFTQTSIVAAGVGALAFLFGDNKLKKYLGLVLIALGFFWRFDAPAVVVAFVIGAKFLFEIIGNRKFELLVKIKQIIPITLVVVLGFGSYTLGFNNWAPWISEEKKQYVELKKVFTQLYGFESTATSYQDLSKPASDVGWSQNDWELYQLYYFADSEIFSLDDQSAIARERIQTSYPRFALSTLTNLIIIFQKYYLYLIAIFLVSLIAVSFIAKRKLLTLLALWSFTFLTYYLILLIGERLPDRVFWPFTFVVAITWLALSILKSQNEVNLFSSVNKLMLLISAVPLFFIVSLIFKETQELIQKEQWWKEAAKQEILNINEVYNFESDKPIMTFFSFYENFRKTLDPIKGPDHLPAIWDQLILIGWENKTPEFNERLRNYGLSEDIFTSIALGDAYLATWNNLEDIYEVENASLFLREHKNIEIIWEPAPFVFSDAGFAIWRAERYEVIK